MENRDDSRNSNRVQLGIDEDLGKNGAKRVARKVILALVWGRLTGAFDRAPSIPRDLLGKSVGTIIAG